MIPFGSFVSLQHLVKVSRRNDSKTNISEMMEGTRDQEIVGGRITQARVAGSHQQGSEGGGW